MRFIQSKILLIQFASKVENSLKFLNNTLNTVNNSLIFNRGGWQMIRIYTRENEIPQDIKEAGVWDDWEYLIVPDSYKDIKKAKTIALTLCDYDFKKFKTKKGRVFFITYYF